ncbi:hypothetical protein [Moorella sp. Hama-1]|uniref:hypothetical protein n=1 Tax=Moorella sp. Hama-1 TaxID=2138101 RepID=UPI0012901ADD|nr:hypothetical protein [Moorella sp. Hama-1]BCV20789.1 hypothetical protein hamaS1_08580 [Moorella sp. Hama-1]
MLGVVLQVINNLLQKATGLLLDYILGKIIKIIGGLVTKKSRKRYATKVYIVEKNVKQPFRRTIF